MTRAAKTQQCNSNSIYIIEWDTIMEHIIWRHGKECGAVVVVHFNVPLFINLIIIYYYLLNPILTFHQQLIANKRRAHSLNVSCKLLFKVTRSLFLFLQCHVNTGSISQSLIFIHHSFIHPSISFAYARGHLWSHDYVSHHNISQTVSNQTNSLAIQFSTNSETVNIPTHENKHKTCI